MTTCAVALGGILEQRDAQFFLIIELGVAVRKGVVLT
jgi:hypothetical protein